MVIVLLIVVIVELVVEVVRGTTSITIATQVKQERIGDFVNP